MNLSQDFVYVNGIRFPSGDVLLFLSPTARAVLALVTAFLAPLVPTLGGILFDVYLLIFNEVMLEIELIEFRRRLSQCEIAPLRKKYLSFWRFSYYLLTFYALLLHIVRF